MGETQLGNSGSMFRSIRKTTCCTPGAASGKSRRSLSTGRILQSGGQAALSRGLASQCSSQRSTRTEAIVKDAIQEELDKVIRPLTEQIRQETRERERLEGLLRERQLGTGKMN